MLVIFVVLWVYFIDNILTVVFLLLLLCSLECVVPSPNNNDDGSLTVYLVQAAGGEFDGTIQGDACLTLHHMIYFLVYLRIHDLILR